MHLAGRQDEIQRFRATLRAAPEIPANIRLTGLRGVGKTVLLDEFKTVADNEGWAATHIEIEPRHNTEEALAQIIGQTSREIHAQLSTAQKLKQLGKRVAAGAAVGYGDMSLSFQGMPTEEDVAKTLTDLTEFADEKGKAGVALLLDEAQTLRDERSSEGEHPLSLLIAAVSGIQRAGGPLALVLCGLPTLASNLLNARTYSERMFRGEIVATLDRHEAEAAFVEPLKETPVRTDVGLVKRVLETVEGYPYFIQLWGAELWDAADAADVSRFTVPLLLLIEQNIYRRVDIDFYDPRVATLTPAEQDILLVSAECHYPPIVVSDINNASLKSSNNVNVLLGRLVEAGVLYRIRKGQYAYTAPKFYEYLQRRVQRLNHI